MYSIKIVFLIVKILITDSVTSNLIDLNCEVAAPPMPLPRREHDYVNSNRDVFDMREYQVFLNV